MISIIIPSYRRSIYLRRALKSVKEFADMEYELIVHDEESSEETLNVITKFSSTIDTAILNFGPNVGLNVAINRCVSAASGDIILFIGDDCWLTDFCLRDVYNILQKKYIGWVCPGDNRLINLVKDEYILEFNNNIPVADSNETRFALTNNLLGAYTLGFRKEVWREVEGWEEKASTARSDNIFLGKLMKAGYWKGVLEGRSRIALANNEPGYIASASFMKQNNYDVAWENQQTQVAAGLANLQYWFDYFFSIFGTKFHSIFDMQNISYDTKRINWDIASIHGQNRWKKEILNDFE